MMNINPNGSANAQVHSRPQYRYTPAVYAVIFFLFIQPAVVKRHFNAMSVHKASLKKQTSLNHLEIVHDQEQQPECRFQCP